MRFSLKSLGLKLASPDTDCFAKRARLTLGAMIEPTLEVIDVITRNVKELTRRIERLGELKYPETKRIRQMVGIGPI